MIFRISIYCAKALFGLFFFFTSNLMGLYPALSVPYLNREVRGALPGCRCQAFACGKDLACDSVVAQGSAVLSV